MASTNIIKNLRTKDNSGFSSPYPLGTDPFYISSLRGSNVNNLEENFFIGTDCITSSWEDENGVLRTVKEFYNAEVENPVNYYVLEIYDYISGSATKEYIDYMPDGEDPSVSVLTLKIAENQGYADDNKFYIDSDEFTFNIDKSEVLISSTNLLDSTEQLYFINHLGNKILVSEKNTYTFIDDDGKKIKKEVITNHLL